jgi:RNA polymerase sigma-B factor
MEGDALIREFMPLARRIALRFRHTGEALDDLIGAANLGLVKAARRFDPSHGTPFSHYASVSIAGEIRHHLSRSRWVAHVPRDARDRAVSVHREIGRAEAAGRPHDLAGLANACGMEERELRDALLARAAFSWVSLDEPLGHGPGSIIESLAADEPGYDRVDDRLALRLALRDVQRQDRRILQLRFGGDLTQTEIASITGVSQMQVSRVIRRALATARRAGADAAAAGDRRAAISPPARAAAS